VAGDTPEREGRAWPVALGRKVVGAECEGLLHLWGITVWCCARDD
jgi:hypothetical protein